MNMYFNTDVHLKNLLFKDLNITSAKDVALVSVVTFLATVIFSALSAAKEIIAAKRKMNPLARSQQDLDNYSLSVESTSSQNDLLSSLRIPTNVGVVRRHKFQLFALESLIHMIKFGYGYLLMLLVMTYNVWLALGVILGSGLGFFLFNPLSSHICSLYSQPPVSKRQCCDGDAKTDSANHSSNNDGNSVMHQPSTTSTSSSMPRDESINRNNGQSEPLLHPSAYHQHHHHSFNRGGRSGYPGGGGNSRYKASNDGRGQRLS